MAYRVNAACVTTGKPGEWCEFQAAGRALADDVEEQICGSAVAGDVSELIQDQEIRGGVSAEAAFCGGKGLLAKQVDKSGGDGRKTNSVAAFECTQAEILGERGLADTGLAAKEKISDRSPASVGGSTEGIP